MRSVYLGPLQRYRLEVGLRVIAAVFIGYAVTYLATGALSLWLPGQRSEAILWASIFSFVIYAAVALYAFAVRDVWRLWRNLAVVLVLLILAIGVGR